MLTVKKLVTKSTIARDTVCGSVSAVSSSTGLAASPPGHRSVRGALVFACDLPEVYSGPVGFIILNTMALAPGTRLGPYEIDTPLGAGGMGEVYRALDTRLERTVAIKILPAQFSSDSTHKQRFEREAKTISHLNHPHICVLHDIGHQDGIDYLVMECVEGETLAKRLEKGPLPLEQMLKVGAHVADALDKAHQSGVVHRDLKPGNIMLTPSGAKLLDFGLAKPTPLADLATLTAAKESPVTERGTIVGTFQYMSPEQVEGKELDGRSDIFSLGAVLYEIVTGKKAFEGKSQLSVASAILEKEPPPIRTLKPLTPPALEHAIKKSLAKLPEERWQSASDLASELKWIAEGSSQAGVPSPLPKSWRNRERIGWALAAILAVVSLAGAVAYRRLASFTPPVVVSDLVWPRGTQYASLVNGRPAISPDGRLVAFAAHNAGELSSAALWVRSLDGSSAQRIAGTEESGEPFWSPDSRKIGFFANRKLQWIDISGGTATILAAAPGGHGGAWSRDGTILFARFDGIYQVPASGGSVALVLRRDPKYAFLFSPVFLPDGRHFLYQASGPGVPADAYFASLDGKENRPLLQGSGLTLYTPGSLLYVLNSRVVAQPFESRSGQLTGSPRPITDQVQQGNFGPLYDASENGILIYEPATHAGTQLPWFLAWFDRTGKRLSSIGLPGSHYDLRLSPDARKLATSAGDPRQSEMWVDDLDRGVRMRLTFDPDTDNGIPVWSPDGSTLLFSTLVGSKVGVGIFRKASNGAGGQELVLPTDRPDRETWATDWSRDGRFLLLSRGGMAENTDADIWVLPMSGERKPVLFLHTKGSAFEAQFSPDGRWVAFSSTESGSSQVYVVSFDAAKALSGSAGAPRGKWQISSDGGHAPRWRRDGKELFYLGFDNAIRAVEVEGNGASFNAGRSQILFVAPINPFSSTFDVAPDGQRFVMSASPAEEEPPLVLMSNWTSKLQPK